MLAFPYLFPNSIFRVNIVTIAMLLLSGLIVLIVLRIAARKLDVRHPRGLQNAIEWAIEFTRTLARDTVPSEQMVPWILPLAFTMITFLFVANWLGIIMTISLHVNRPIPQLGITSAALAAAHGEVPLFDSPTANMSMTLGLAVMVWIISHIQGLRTPRAYFRHFLTNPMALIEEITNPLTHGMRLYGNIFAGEALIGTILTIFPRVFGWIPTGLPFLVVWLFYCAFVSTIQAYVFTILMSLYIGQKSYRYHTDH